jgi:hypothetical protein
MAERKSFLLRVDAGLWAELEAWAQDELRSVNGQIEYLLRDAVHKRRGRPLVPQTYESKEAEVKKKPRR